MKGMSIETKDCFSYQANLMLDLNLDTIAITRQSERKEIHPIPNLT